MSNDMHGRTLDSYLRVQARNLEAMRRLPHFALVERVGALYDRSLAALPPPVSGWLLQLFIACHQALLSAAATIGRAQPVDSIGVTRRAAEVARTAAAIKHDPANRERWLAIDVRLSRWDDRLGGRKPDQQPKGGITYPPSAPVEWLGRQLGILSDTGAHFTPEYFGTLDRRVLDEGARADGRVEVEFGYFETSQPEIERALMYLATVHLQILAVFDECFDGTFCRDRDWAHLREEIGERGRALAGAFTSEADGGEDERADHK